MTVKMGHLQRKVVSELPAEERRGEHISRLAQRLNRSRKRKPGLALVLGAGVSFDSGIPMTAGWVPLLCRVHEGTDIRPDHVQIVIEATKQQLRGYKSLGRELATCMDRTARKIDFEAGLENYPEHSVALYTKIMNDLEPEEQRKAVSQILNAAEQKITWQYLRISQLVKLGFVDTILTTNLDLVLLKALALFDIYPAVCDFHEAAVLRSTDASEPQLIYLHGNQHSYNVRNTDIAVSEYGKSLQRLIRRIIDDRTLLVCGYSGVWQDGLMEILQERYVDKTTNPHLRHVVAPHDIYWCFYGSRPEKPPLPGNDQVHYLEYACASTTFRELCDSLGVPPPDLVRDPLKHFLRTLRSIDLAARESVGHGLKQKIDQIADLANNFRTGVDSVALIEDVRNARFDDAAQRAFGWFHKDEKEPPGIEQMIQLIANIRDIETNNIRRRLDLEINILDAVIASAAPNNRASLYVAKAESLRLLGDYWIHQNPAEAEECFVEAIGLLERFREYRGLGHAQRGLGVVKFYNGSLDEALAMFEQAELSFTKEGNEGGAARAKSNRASVLQMQNNLGLAMTLYEELERGCRDRNDKDGLQRVLINQSIILREQHDNAAAKAKLDEAERICRDCDSPSYLHQILGNKVPFLVDGGQFREALDVAIEQERICRHLGDKHGLRRAVGNQAEILRKLGELTKASALLQEAKTLCDELNDMEGLTENLLTQAENAFQAGRLKVGLALAEEATQFAREHGYLGLQQKIEKTLKQIREVQDT